MATEIVVNESPIKGLFVIDLALKQDRRGWFKENYQQQKMEQLGLPHFEVVQNNFSYNLEKGVSRGLHAEPWEKFVSLANGRVFCAWADLRKGEGFGKVFTLEINPGLAVFVPRGVANGYQTLEDKVTYTYLVNSHWSDDAKYGAVNMLDPELGIDWPISKEESIISDKDHYNPVLSDVTPMEF
jgi:dTDP-4-dehydrorhamnose 3,5-epimerase